MSNVPFPFFDPDSVDYSLILRHRVYWSFQPSPLKGIFSIILEVVSSIENACQVQNVIHITHLSQMIHPIFFIHSVYTKRAVAQSNFIIKTLIFNYEKRKKARKGVAQQFSR